MYVVDNIFAALTCVHVLLRIYFKGKDKYFRRAHNLIELAVTVVGGGTVST